MVLIVMSKWGYSMEMRVTTKEEEKYLYGQSDQLRGQTSYIGQLTCDFGEDGKSFHSAWSNSNERLRTKEFVEDYNRVFNTLRERGNFLHNRKSAMEWAAQHPESILKTHKSKVYGFRMDTEKYSYLLRLPHPVTDSSIYCLCYVKESFNRHMAEARKGIRFITPSYKEMFHIADGDRVIITTATGEKNEHICRYIDECHVEIGNNLYHVCEFAELMKKIGSTCKPAEESV